MQGRTPSSSLVIHQGSHSWPMEDRSDSPMAVKVEEHSQCVILTYFQGDINSMVDAHFTRALSKVKAKAPAVKTKKIRKTVKLEETRPSRESAVDSCSESQVPPVAGCLLTFSPAEDDPGSWHSFTARAGEGPGSSSITYSLSPEGLSLTGQQYATSLLNLLHNDRGEMRPSMASTSKPELLPSWTMPQGFRESMDPAVDYEPGRRLDKKDLYWY
ncbi:transcription cofactor vestigial-like protein 1 [Siniperca chuatsi]|uniref:transcription cofactor vestigial-like protein 1 n=1 Tax=Siniperca chuatsi TaxID=119488 RepID=UPI001CE223CF|nr:transcription cofactor vestigial-like protein 1 [Siniperca chuatsi]